MCAACSECIRKNDNFVVDSLSDEKSPMVRLLLPAMNEACWKMVARNRKIKTYMYSQNLYNLEEL